MHLSQCTVDLCSHRLVVLFFFIALVKGNIELYFTHTLRFQEPTQPNREERILNVELGCILLTPDWSQGGLVVDGAGVG